METMKNLVEFCTNNYSHGTKRVKKKLQANPDYEVMEYGCLGHCRHCLHRPIALVEGEFCETNTTKELLHEIDKKVADKKEWDKLFENI